MITMRNYHPICLLLLILELVFAQVNQQVNQNTQCNLRSSSGFSLSWSADSSGVVTFDYSHPGFPTTGNYWTGVAFGDSYQTRVDAVIIEVQNGQITVSSGSLIGSRIEKSYPNILSVQSSSVYPTVSATFTRPLYNDGKSLDTCNNWKFYTEPTQIYQFDSSNSYVYTGNPTTRSVCSISTSCPSSMRYGSSSTYGAYTGYDTSYTTTPYTTGYGYSTTTTSPYSQAYAGNLYNTGYTSSPYSSSYGSTSSPYSSSYGYSSSPYTSTYSSSPYTSSYTSSPYSSSYSSYSSSPYTSSYTSSPYSSSYSATTPSYYSQSYPNAYSSSTTFTTSPYAYSSQSQMYNQQTTYNPYQTTTPYSTSPYSASAYSYNAAPSQYSYSSNSQPYGQGTSYSTGSNIYGSTAGNIYGYSYDNSASSPSLVQNDNYKYVDDQTQQWYLRNYNTYTPGSSSATGYQYYDQNAPAVSNEQQNTLNYQRILEDYRRNPNPNAYLSNANTNIYGYDYTSGSTGYSATAYPSYSYSTSTAAPYSGYATTTISPYSSFLYGANTYSPYSSSYTSSTYSPYSSSYSTSYPNINSAYYDPILISRYLSGAYSTTQNPYELIPQPESYVNQQFDVAVNGAPYMPARTSMHVIEPNSGSYYQATLKNKK